jgi:hypothetical protein
MSVGVGSEPRGDVDAIPIPAGDLVNSGPTAIDMIPGEDHARHAIYVA